MSISERGIQDHSEYSNILSQDTSGAISSQGGYVNKFYNTILNSSDFQEEGDIPKKISPDHTFYKRNYHDDLFFKIITSFLFKSLTSNNNYILLSEIEDILKNKEYFDSIRHHTKYITDEAELWLSDDKYMLESIYNILIRFTNKLESISYNIGLEVFYDVELENWGTFRIVVKPKEVAEENFDQLMELWDELSVLSNNIFNNLSENNDINKNKIDEIKSKVIVSIDI